MLRFCSRGAQNQMETNAERRPRIIEIVILVIYLFVMPLELKSSILMGRGVKRAPSLQRNHQKEKGEFRLLFKGPKRQQVTVVFRLFEAFAAEG